MSSQRSQPLSAPASSGVVNQTEELLRSSLELIPGLWHPQIGGEMPQVHSFDVPAAVFLSSSCFGEFLKIALEVLFLDACMLAKQHADTAWGLLTVG